MPESGRRGNLYQNNGIDGEKRLGHSGAAMAGPKTIETGSSTDLESYLEDVRVSMAEHLAGTSLRHLIGEFKNLLGSGKMLRSRIAFHLGPTTSIPYDLRVKSAAAVEMVHAASLLHDDVIDGGLLRRGAPTFWVERGVSGAILLGDMLLFKSLDMLTGTGREHILKTLIKCTGEVCEAESEQELLLRGKSNTWDTCLSIARRKTGALFAFVAYACATDDTQLAQTLLESGYQVGTAYQVADDILDATGDSSTSDKSLGSDENREKTTAMRVALEGINPILEIERLCRDSAEALTPWPAVQNAWQHYLDQDFWPAVQKNIERFSQA